VSEQELDENRLPEVVDHVAVARLYGEPLFALPQDLYIPPDALEVFLETFEGPLDLLLYLIRKQNFNILDIPLADVTRQYLTYVDQIRKHNLELASEYLLMAAMLIEIKSRMLLPPKKTDNGEEAEDPRAELVRRLIEYERIKLAAAKLNNQPLLGRDFLRVQVHNDPTERVRHPDVSLVDLREAWADILKRARLHTHHTITREELSVREYMGNVLRLLQGKRFVEFEDLFDVTRGPQVLVVTFIAMLELARERLIEITQAEADLTVLEGELQTALLPKDPDDVRNAFLEIRAGTGGDESALFAADLARMYTRYAERQGWRTEIMSASESDLGGYKEIVLRFEGSQIYGALKFESGGHRVQRVPVTETQGRIHTSACTVAVLPEPDEAEEVELNPADLRIDTYRASGAGGQHINKTHSAVRITHIPTGIVAECQDDRSQHRNKAKALAVLAARIRDKERTERQAKEAAHRKSLVGTGDRSDRIRTYNFPQGRLTDHRINLTLYKLGAIMEGELDEVVQALQTAQAAAQLAELEAATGV